MLGSAVIATVPASRRGGYRGGEVFALLKIPRHQMRSMSIRCLMSLLIAALLMATGCGRLAYKPNQQAAAAAEQQMQLVAQQNQEYQSRAQSLDRDNQELESILAQSRQKVQLLTD